MSLFGSGLQQRSSGTARGSDALPGSLYSSPSDASARFGASEDDEVHLLSQQQQQLAALRVGAPGQQRPQRGSTASSKQSLPPAPVSSAKRTSSGSQQRRRWLAPEDGTDDAQATGDGGPGGYSIPAARSDGQGGGNTGHIIRMRRSEAWSKFLAYEGCCQVCMREGAKGVPDAAYFLGSGCEPLRAGLGITGLLLPQVLASHMAMAVGSGSQAIDLGNEIVWDDFEADDRRLNAAAFMNHMSVMRVRVARLELPQSGLGVLSRLVCRNLDYSRITVHLKLLMPADVRAGGDVPYRLRKDGAVLPGSPMFDLQPDHHGFDAVLEVVQGGDVLARGKVSCKRLWQIGMEHSPMDGADDWDEGASEAEGGGASQSPNKGTICSWLKCSEDVQVSRDRTALWVNVFDAGPTPGRVLLTIQRSQRELPGGAGDGAAREDGPGKGTLKVSSCQAYDYILLAALRSQGCNEKRLEITGEWAWLLQAFAGQYGVRSNYAVMAHLRWVLRPGVASVSQTCFDLLAHKLRPLLEQEGGSLTQQEATTLAQIKGDTEELLKLAFENYYLLSSCARKGILDGACSPPPGHNEFPPTALVAGVHLYEAMRDVFHPSDVEWMTDRFKVAAKGRWGRLATLCEDSLAGPGEGSPSPLGGGGLPGGLRSSHRPLGRDARGSPASGKAGPGKGQVQVYVKMIRMGAAIQQDLEYDRRLQDVPRLLPSSVNLPAITAAEYCANYVGQLKAALAQAPPHQPSEAAIDLLAATAQLQRYLEEHRLTVPRGQPGCIDSLELFGPFVRAWIANSQEALCATCRSLEATTELSSLAAAATQAAPPLGSSEEGGVAPICHEMLRHVVTEMQRYERVISHWPLFGPYLEAALCVVLRALVAAVSRQCGMTRVRGGGPSGPAGLSPLDVLGGRGGAASLRGGPGRYSGSPGDFRSQGRAPVSLAQWAWAGEGSPRKGDRLAAAPPRLTLMVREAVLLNSLKRLMVAAPIYEATINKWSGGHSAPPGQAAEDVLAGYDEIAPVGAQFAQVVKELRTEYSSGLASTCGRMAGALSGSAATSLSALLQAAKASSDRAGAMTAMQQAAMIEQLSQGLFSCLHELLGALAAALDARVFVAMGRGLWDFVGRDLLEFVEQLQEGRDNKGAWRTRQNASLLLDAINRFFRAGLVQAMEHVLQERDLALPLHIDATHKLLAGNTTALNQNYTPF